MDQVKEFLRQVVKYRFWISVVIATLFAGGAYVLGSGPIQKQTEDTTTKIKTAAKDVQQYSGPTVPTPAYKPIVEEKTEVLTKDVNVAWKELYNRQAPYLTWPESVSDRFRKWGRKWPAEEAADSAVQLAIIDYVMAYPKYVEDVYKVFKPFDYTKGDGIVAAPPSDALLRPTTFDLNKKPPKLGEVWSSQERLWAQRTVLEVVAGVNRNATDWESAYLKEIKALEVGNATAQDQKSIAEGKTLEKAEAILAPGESEEEEEDPSGGMMGGMMNSSMMAGMKKMGGMGGGAGASNEPVDVEFLIPEGTTQFKILPIMLTVLIDQDHIQDLLVELENSPMAIEVKELEMNRPQTRVTKPEKGTQPMGYSGMMGGMGGMMGGMGGMMGMMGSMRNRGMMGGGSMGYGGMSSMMSSMMARGGMRGGGGGEDMTGMMMGGMGGMMGRGGAAAEKKGEDRRSVKRAEEREKEEKAIASVKGTSLFDPYFNIVEVTVYGQARFYNEPPAEVEEPASPGEAGADGSAAGAEPAKAEAPSAEPGKAEAPAAEPAKTEAPKSEAPAAEPAKAEAPKAEGPSTEAPKADGADAAKPDAAPAEPGKAQAAAPKADAAPRAEAKPAEPKS